MNHALPDDTSPQQVFTRGRAVTWRVAPGRWLPDASCLSERPPKPSSHCFPRESPRCEDKREQPLRGLRPPPLSSRGPGVLVVDDDAGVRTLLNNILRQQGFAAWLAGDGKQAVELYQEWCAEIDLVLLDVRMPGLDGPQTMAALRRFDPEVRCCFMTGDSGDYTVNNLLEQGAARVISKPFHLQDIMQLLGEMVRDCLKVEA